MGICMPLSVQADSSQKATRRRFLLLWQAINHFSPTCFKWCKVGLQKVTQGVKLFCQLAQVN